MNPITKTIFLSFFIFSSCTVKLHLPEGEPVPEQLAKKCLQRLNNQYPSSFQLTQRILLTVSGKEYDFIGSLTMHGDSVFRAVALGEMGGIFLDLQYDSGRVRILKNPGRMPGCPLTDGVARDILHLYAFSFNNRDIKSSLKNKRLYMQLSDSGVVSDLLTFERQNLIVSEQIIDRRVVCRAQYQNYTKQEGFGCPLPSRILVENKKWHYSLKIDLLKIIKFSE